VLLHELDNLIAASRRAVSRGDVSVAVGAGIAAARTLTLRGPIAAALPILEEIEPIAGDRRRVVWLERAAALRLVGRARESVPLLQQLHHEAKSSFEVATALRSLGRSYYLLGQVEDARSCFEEAQVHFTGLGQRRLCGSTLLQMGLVNADQGRLDDALVAYREALALFEDLGDAEGQSQTRANLALALMDTGHLAEARAHLEEAIPMYEAAGDRRGVALHQGNLGILLARIGQTDEAVAWMEASLEGHRKVGERRSQGIMLGNLSWLAKSTGRLDDAVRYGEASLALHREVGNRRSEGIVLGNLGGLWLARGELDRAEGLIDEAIAIHRETRNAVFEGVALAALGALAAARDEVDLAAEHYLAAEALGRQTGDVELLGDAISQHSRLLIAQGELREGRDLLREAFALEGVDAVVDRGAWLAQLGAVEARLGDPTGLDRYSEGCALIVATSDLVGLCAAQLAGVRAYLDLDDHDAAARVLISVEYQLRSLELGADAPLVREALQLREQLSRS